MKVKFSITESATYEGKIELSEKEYAMLKKETDDNIGNYLTTMCSGFYDNGAIEREYNVSGFHRVRPIDGYP